MPIHGLQGMTAVDRAVDCLTVQVTTYWKTFLRGGAAHVCTPLVRHEIVNVFITEDTSSPQLQLPSLYSGPLANSSIQKLRCANHSLKEDPGKTVTALLLTATQGDWLEPRYTWGELVSGDKSTKCERSVAFTASHGPSNFKSWPHDHQSCFSWACWESVPFLVESNSAVIESRNLMGKYASDNKKQNH